MADHSIPRLLGFVPGDGQTRADSMRSLSVRQPWAWAIMHGGKNVENRRWSTSLGTVAIHASLSYEPSAEEFYPLREAWARLRSVDPSVSRLDAVRHTFPVGVILGTVDIVDVHCADRQRGCYRQTDVLGWTPLDGSDASAPGWRPRSCSTWGEYPNREHVRGSGAMRHFVLANPLPLDHPVLFRGHQGIRVLDPEIASAVRSRLLGQSSFRF